MKIPGSQPVAGYAERKERNPKVAIFDYFAQGREEPRHGENMEKVLLSTTGLKDEDVQNFVNTYDREATEEAVFAAKPEDLFQKMRAFTEQTVTGFYQATTQNLDTITSNPENTIRVINQSQSQSAARVSRPFVEKITSDESFLLSVKEALGMPLQASAGNVAQAFLNEVQTTFNESENIERARQDYTRSAKTAYDQGIVHVVTAGNLGRVTTAWEELGIQAPQNAYKSVLANEYTTVIGATDSRGTTTIRDDRAAAFTSIYAGTEFAMHGVNVEVVSDDATRDRFSNGTSYAAPQVTGLISDMLGSNPKLGVAQVEGLLRSSIVPVSGTVEQLGAGQIDPDRALFLASQTAFIATL